MEGQAGAEIGSDDSFSRFGLPLNRKPAPQTPLSKVSTDECKRLDVSGKTPYIKLREKPVRMRDFVCAC